MDAPDASYLVEWQRAGGSGRGELRTRAHKVTITGLAYGTYVVRVRTQRYEVEYSTWTSAEPITVPDRRQRIVDFAGLPPTLRSAGTTLIVPCHLMTNAGQRVKVGVRWEVLDRMIRGSFDPVVVRRGACGRVIIALNGTPVRVSVTLAAPPQGRYAAILRTTRYRVP